MTALSSIYSRTGLPRDESPVKPSGVLHSYCIFRPVLGKGDGPREKQTATMARLPMILGREQNSPGFCRGFVV
jgi:hypothetical protein